MTSELIVAETVKAVN